MEHDLPLPEHSEDRLGSRLAVSHIQASAEAAWQRIEEEGGGSGEGGRVKHQLLVLLETICSLFALSVSCN